VQTVAKPQPAGGGFAQKSFVVVRRGFAQKSFVVVRRGFAAAM